MKVLGQTYIDIMAKDVVNDAYGFIVQLNSKEYKSLIKLAESLNGRNYDRFDDYFERNPPKEVDLSKALEAVNSFADIKYSVEQLKSMVQGLDDKLMVKDNA